jgi:pimeloyl-ACP methyl ester carboxylesterase
MKNLTLAVALALATTATGIPTQMLLAAAPKQTQQRGTLINVESLGVASQATLQKIASEFPGKIAMQQDVELFRITYWTVYKGKPTKASGLLGVPKNVSRPKGVMMYLHGTNNTRTLSPSQPNRADGNSEAAIFGGNGYLVVLPDYIGQGISQDPHPYIITKPLVDDAVDMLKAVRQVAKDRTLDWSPNLFMMGFSQGGQVVAGVHRELDRRPLADYQLKGSVAVAGPYELRKTSLPKAIENECLKCVGYLAWGASAYASYYGQDLREALKPAYADVVPKLFDGSKTMWEIGAALPARAEDMFQPKFLNAMRANGDNWFTKGMDRNETYRWVPVAPIRLYHGAADVDVTPEASKAFVDYAKPRGGNVSLYALNGVDHMGSISLASTAAFNWFEEMSRGN